MIYSIIPLRGLRGNAGICLSVMRVRRGVEPGLRGLLWGGVAGPSRRVPHGGSRRQASLQTPRSVGLFLPLGSATSQTTTNENRTRASAASAPNRTVKASGGRGSRWGCSGRAVGRGGERPAGTLGARGRSSLSRGFSARTPKHVDFRKCSGRNSTVNRRYFLFRLGDSQWRLDRQVPSRPLGRKEPLLAPWAAPRPARCWSGAARFLGWGISLFKNAGSRAVGEAPPIQRLSWGWAAGGRSGRGEGAHGADPARCRSGRRTWEGPRRAPRRRPRLGSEGLRGQRGPVTGEVASGDVGGPQRAVLTCGRTTLAPRCPPSPGAALRAPLCPVQSATAPATA